MSRGAGAARDADAHPSPRAGRRPAGTTTWRDAARAAVAALEAAGIDGAAREVGWLVRDVAGDRAPRAASADTASADAEADPEALARFESLVARRAAGEPLQYVMGHWPFRSLTLAVDARALIPRPETEVVAEVALAELDALGVDAPTVVDLGTGTGALALAVALERPRARVLAVDASVDALALAAENRARLGLEADRVDLLEGSWFDPLPAARRGHIDLIVSNPPYVATGDEVDPAVEDWEPAGALFAGLDGLDAVRVVVAGAPGWLAPHGVLVVEIGATQAAAVTGLARRAGFAHVEVHPDLAGRDRVLVARFGDPRPGARGRFTSAR